MNILLYGHGAKLLHSSEHPKSLAKETTLYCRAAIIPPKKSTTGFDPQRKKGVCAGKEQKILNLLKNPLKTCLSEAENEKKT